MFFVTPRKGRASSRFAPPPPPSLHLTRLGGMRGGAILVLGCAAGAGAYWWSLRRRVAAEPSASSAPASPEPSKPVDAPVAVESAGAVSLQTAGAATTPAASTAAWGELCLEGWLRTAAAADGRGCPADEDAPWISCRAARAAAARPARRDGARETAEADKLDLEHGVWCMEDEDRYSGAGGRELSEDEMRRVLDRDACPLSDFWRNKYESDARRCWDVFYHVNKTNFFKDRHYLDREWPQLAAPNLKVLDLGCGVGNTTLPLLALNPSIALWSCDFAPNAVRLMKESPGFDAQRCTAFVNDMTCEPLSDAVPACEMDLALLIFVLSAISPDKMVHSLQNLATVMRPGGQVLLRDYGIYDMAEIRLAEQKGHKISDNFYVRKDGTRAYYFSEEVWAHTPTHERGEGGRERARKRRTDRQTDGGRGSRFFRVMSGSLRGGCWSGAGCCGEFWLTASLCMRRCWPKYFWRQASRSWTSKCTSASCGTERSRLICTAGGCRAPSSSQLRLCLYDHRPVRRKHQHTIIPVLGPCSSSPAEGLLLWRREQWCAGPGYRVILGFFTKDVVAALSTTFHCKAA